MIELGRHAGFVAAAYAGTGLMLALAIFAVGLGALRAERRLRELEARGIRRRSDEPG